MNDDGLDAVVFAMFAVALLAIAAAVALVLAGIAAIGYGLFALGRWLLREHEQRRRAALALKMVERERASTAQQIIALRRMVEREMLEVARRDGAGGHLRDKRVVRHG